MARPMPDKSFEARDEAWHQGMILLTVDTNGEKR